MKCSVSNVCVKTLFAVGLLLLGFALAQFVPPLTRAPAPPPPAAESVSVAKTVSVMIDEGNGIVKVVRDLPWQDNATVYDALKLASEKGGFALGVKDYGGTLGVFVESIDGKKGGKDSWWQYWVNNAYGDKGASTATIHAGDVIEWKLTKGQLAS